MRQELIKSILDEKKKKKKPIGQLYSVTPVFSDTTVGTPEGMEENVLSEEFNCKYVSDKIRYDEIKNALLDDYWDDDEFCSEDDLYETEWLTKTLNKENYIDYYELFVPECWKSLFDKPEYKGLSKKESIIKLVNERFNKIADNLNFTISDWGFDGKILNIKFEKNNHESEINEMGGLSDTLGQNDLPQVPKWESGMGRGHANPIDSKIAWQSGISRGKANSLFEGLNLPKKNNNEFSYLDDVISRVEKENEPNLGRNVFRIYISGHKTSIMKCLIYPSGNFKILQIYIPFRNDFMSKFGLYDRADFEKIFGEWFKSRHMDKIISEGLNLTKKEDNREPLTYQEILKHYNADHWINKPEWYENLSQQVKSSFMTDFATLGYIAQIDEFLVGFRRNHDPDFIEYTIIKVYNDDLQRIDFGYIRTNKGWGQFEQDLNTKIRAARNKDLSYLNEGLNLLKKPTGINKLSDDEENN